MSKESTASYPIRSVDRVCDILDLLADTQDGLSLMEVAERTALPKSSVFRYLMALENRHYVERSDTQSYRLGRAFRPQHTHAIDQLVSVAEPIITELSIDLGETTNIGVLDGTMIVHAAVVESPQVMRLAARVGERGYLHATALGKAIAAGLPADEVRSIVTAAGMPRFTDATIIDFDELLDALDEVKRQGYAVDDGENQADGRCLAVPLTGLPIPAGVSVSAPAHRFTRAEIPAAAKQLRRAARKIVKAFDA